MAYALELIVSVFVRGKKKVRMKISPHKDRYHQLSKYWPSLLNHPVSPRLLKASLYKR
jgi:hypothetical protein